MKKILLFAAAAALLTGLLLFAWLGNLERQAAAPAAEPGPTVTVYLTAEAIPACTPITRELVTAAEYPESLVPANAALDPAEIAGKVCAADLVPGQLLLTDMLGELGEEAPGLSYEIPAGMRALTVSVGSTTGAGGYILAGDRIDLLMTCTPETAEGEAAEARTGVLLENVLVLALGEIGFESGLYDSLTLALTPEECLTAVAALNGTEASVLTAVLRARGDESPAPETWVTLAERTGGAA